MFNHILVPLDESELSESALGYVHKIASEGSHVTLLTVIVPPDMSINTMYRVPGQPEIPVDINYEGVERQLRVQAEEYLRAKAKQLAHTGAQVEILVQAGQPADLIVENAKELGVDVIVMATHGRSGISRWLLGSVTQKVLSAAPCPVFVIPSRDNAG